MHEDVAAPTPGRVWSDDEPGLPSCLFLSAEAVAARAAIREQVDRSTARAGATGCDSAAVAGSTPGGLVGPDGGARSGGGTRDGSTCPRAGAADPTSHALDGAASRGRGRVRAERPGRRSRAEVARAVFESAAWPEFAPPVLGEPTGPMAQVMAAERAVATATAERARAVSALAAERPVSADRQPGERGAMSASRRAARPGVLSEVSEWVVRELRIASAVSDMTAERVLVQGLTLTTRLPGTLAALEGGLLHVGHLPVFLDLVAPIGDDQLRARVEAELLRWSAARAAAGTITTPAQLREKTHRVLLARDARTQAEELRRALATRGVFPSPEPVAGLSGLYTRLATAEAEAVYAALGQLADGLPDDEPAGGGDGAVRRSRAQKMADVLVDLVLRPGSSTLPPVQVSLTVVAAVETLLGGDTPGEIAGRTVPAEQVRALLRLLTDTDLAADAVAGRGPAGTSEEVGAPALVSAEPDDADLDHAAVGGADLDRAAVGGMDLDRAAVGGMDLDRAAVGGTDLDRAAVGGTGLGTAEDGPPSPSAATGERPRDRVGRAVRAGGLGGTGFPCSRGASRAEDALFWSIVQQMHDEVFDPPVEASDRDPLDENPLDEDPPDRRPAGRGPADRSGPRPVDGCEQGASGGRLVEAAEAAVADADRALEVLRVALQRAGVLVRRAQRAAVDDEHRWQTAGGGALDTARATGDTLDAVEIASRRDRAALLDLLGATASTTGGGLAHRPRLALVDALTGALTSLTDLPGLRAGGSRGLGAPPQTDGYRPDAALDRFVRTRDRRCRTPGCRRPVRTGELDHHVPHPAGATSAENLHGLCLGDHRGKHQAPGWRHELDPDGGYRVTTPSGLTARTGPPPL